MNAHLQINSQIPVKKGGVRLLNTQLFKGGGKPLKRIADEGWEKEKLVIFVFGVKLCGLTIKACAFMRYHNLTCCKIVLDIKVDLVLFI